MKIEIALQNYIKYLWDFAQIAPEAIKKNERYLRRVEEELGHLILLTETASQINDAIQKVVESRKTAYNGGTFDEYGRDLQYRTGQAVVCFVRWAVSENIIQRNFYPKNPCRRPPLRKPYSLTKEQVAFLYYVAPMKLIDKAIVRFLYDTSNRVSELCRARIEDVDFVNLKVKTYQTKVGTEKETAISELTADCLINLINARKQKSQFLFANNKGNRYSPFEIRRRLRLLGKKHGFRMNPHSFRHAAITAMWSQAGDIMAAKLAGQRSLRSTAHYVTVNAQDFKPHQKAIRTGLRNAVFAP